MLKRFLPDVRFRRVDDMGLGYLRAEGIRGLIIDIDNTLTEDNRRELDEWARAYINEIRAAGIAVCLVSNNSEERVQPIADILSGCAALPNAGKPSRATYEKALRLLGVERHEAAAVGDQLFTDIWGANRAGIRSVWVNPISKKEILSIRLKRPLERLICKLNAMEMSERK